MKTRAAAPAVAVLILSVLAALGAAAPARAARLHPDLELKDAAGRNVLDSGAPVSPETTCGGCHDTEWIAQHSYHADAGLSELGRATGRAGDEGLGPFGRFDPLTYRRLDPVQGDLRAATDRWLRENGARHVGGGPARPLGLEMDCFLCHASAPAFEARASEIAAGRYAWAATATLSGLGLSEPAEGGWEWRAERFDEHGRIAAEALGLGAPGAAACGNCHGAVDYADRPLRLLPGETFGATASRGEIYSPQRMADSALNLQDKASLDRPFDVHAERLLSCSSCHFSPNDPAHYREADLSRPAHLKDDARTLSIGEFLERPSHQLAKGWPSVGRAAAAFDGTMKRCEDCHSVEATHQWLPYKQRHMQAMVCESCHVSQVAFPALMETDWTLLDPSGEPRRGRRGAEGAVDDPTTLLTGYRPVLLPRREADGRERLAPFNLHAAWFWVAGEEGRPVPRQDLQRALFVDGGYHPAVVKVLDRDGDGHLQADELRLESEEAVAAVARRLQSLGYPDARIRAEVQPLGLHHGVAPGAFALKDCAACHDGESRLSEPMQVATFLPGGVEPRLAADTRVRMDGGFHRGADGGWWYRGGSREAALYLVGHDREPWLDLAGRLALLLVAAGVLSHALLRLLARRKCGGAK